MKTNFAKFAWAAAAVLLSGMSQSAWANNCKHYIKVRNQITHTAVRIHAVIHKWELFVATVSNNDWEANTEFELNTTRIHDATHIQTSPDCQDLKWRAEVNYTCDLTATYFEDTHAIHTQYLPAAQYGDVYIDLTECTGAGYVNQTGFSDFGWDILVAGSELSCETSETSPRVTLYPGADKSGEPVVIENKSIVNLGDMTDTSGQSLNDWAGSLEVTSGTWRFFKHANFEGPQLYVAAPHAVGNMSSGHSSWSDNKVNMAFALTSLKPVHCSSIPLGRNDSGEKVRMGYIYGFGDNGCLQKAATGYRDGINIHYWDPATGYIHNLENPEYCVYKPAARFKAGDNIRLWRCDDGAAENKAWDYNVTTHQITPRDERGKGFCIDHSGTSNGGKIHLWSCSPNDGNSNNQWKIAWGAAATELNNPAAKDHNRERNETRSRA